MQFKYGDMLLALRIYIARELSHKYKIPNKDIAEILGITPSAVSQYLKGKRGKKYETVLDNIEKNPHIKLLIENFLNETLKRKELKLPVTEFYFLNLINDIYSSLSGIKNF